jgi:aspartyl-tRNA(Asn)/glutamyl-tRNA(Gln) amidotransferase subunit A
MSAKMAASLRAVVSPVRSCPVSVSRQGSLEGWTLGVKAGFCASGSSAGGGAASAILTGFCPDYTATAVARAAAAGARIDAVTNMDEFGMGSATASSVHGSARNPYSINVMVAGASPNALLPQEGWLTPGGSSGGSAAAVAAGIVRAALGSDTGGSVRQPAAFCGVVGLKPTYGRIPRDGLVAYASSLDTVGILTRTVADAACLLGALEGRGSRDDTSLMTSAFDGISTPMRAIAAGSLTGLRVGIPAEYSVAGLDASMLDWWEWGAAALSAAGAEMVRVSLPNTRHALPAYYVLAAAEAASNLSRYDGLRYGAAAPSSPGESLAAAVSRTRTSSFGTEVRRRIMAGNAVLAAQSRADFYDAAVAAAERVCADFAAVFRAGAVAQSLLTKDWLHTAASPAAVARATQDSGVDLLLAPAVPSSPWISSDTDSLPPLYVYANDVLTVPASLARLPAMSVPVGLAAYPPDALRRALSSGLDMSHVNADELAVPIGLQLIGRFGDDHLLLKVAAVLERTAQFEAPRYITHSLN